MKNQRQLTLSSLATIAALTLAVGSASASTTHTPADGPSNGRTPTIVLVHGAWADASSWAEVTKRLQKQGFTVLAPPTRCVVYARTQPI